MVNDSGSPAEIYLLETNGNFRGKVTLQGVPNRDWEELAIFSKSGISYLLVADTGDNNATRKDCTLTAIREPPLPVRGQAIDYRAIPEWQIRFQFPDGPRDCEAVSVDPVSDKIILISKRSDPPGVYELPLASNRSDEISVAKRIGSLTIEKTGLSLIPYRDQPTGMSISGDGMTAAVVTYGNTYLYSRKPRESWGTAFGRVPVVLDAHRLAQAEAITFSKAGDRLWITTEGLNPRLRHYQK